MSDALQAPQPPSPVTPEMAKAQLAQLAKTEVREAFEFVRSAYMTHMMGEAALMENSAQAQGFIRATHQTLGWLSRDEIERRRADDRVAAANKALQSVPLLSHQKPKP